MPLITKLTSPKNKKKRGRDSIFKTGRIRVLIIPSIIPQIIYDLKASIDVYAQSPQPKIIQASIPLLAFSARK